MTLRELGAIWIRRGGRIVGVRFECPFDDGPGPHPEGHSICVLFANPPDGGGAHPNDAQCPGNSDGRRWHRTGANLDDLSLSPSVDCTRPGHPCWHGFVSNGRAD